MKNKEQNNMLKDIITDFRVKHVQEKCAGQERKIRIRKVLKSNKIHEVDIKKTHFRRESQTQSRMP